MKISTTILTAKDRIASVKLLNKTDTDYIHIDVMDNIFVPNYQMPIDEVNNLLKVTEKPFDIHLMVEDPESFIKNLDKGNIDSITIHLEIKKDIDHLINLIKSYNYHVGIAIKMDTDPDLLDKYLDKIDFVLVMSIIPGFGGQKFNDKAIEQIKAIRSKNSNILISVDGGINNETIEKIKYLADTAAVGSYITNSDNYQKAIDSLRN